MRVILVLLAIVGLLWLLLLGMVLPLFWVLAIVLCILWSSQRWAAWVLAIIGVACTAGTHWLWQWSQTVQ